MLRVAQKTPKYSAVVSHSSLDAQLTFTTLAILIVAIIVLLNTLEKAGRIHYLFISLTLAIFLFALSGILLVIALWHASWMNGICVVSALLKHNEEVSQIPLHSAMTSWEEKNSRYELHNIPERFVITPNPLETPKSLSMV